MSRRGGVGPDPAVQHVDHPAGLFTEALIMSDHHERGSILIETAEEGEDLLSRSGIELAGRLVSQKQHWAVGQRTGNGYPLHFTPGELSGAVPCPVGQANIAEQVESALAPLLPRYPGLRHRKLYVLLGSEHREEVETLENEAQPGQAKASKLAIGQLVQADAQQVDAARGWGVDSSDQLEQRRFAAAGGTCNHDVLPRIYREGNASQRLHRLMVHGIALGQISNQQNRPAHVASALSVAAIGARDASHAG